MRTITESTVLRIFLSTLIFCPLAFGTVETWSVLIMEAGIFSALFLYLFLIRKRGGQGMIETPGLMPLAALLCYILFQAIPLPPGLIQMLSPSAFALYSQSVWVAQPGAWATLSLYPKATVSEFLRIASYAGAYILTVQFLSESRRFRKTIGLLSIFAVAVAFFSIIQHLAPNGKIYWIRELTQGGVPFGPYVNRNHFAGLMVMLLPILMVRFLLSRPSSHQDSLRGKVSEFLHSSLTNIHLLLGFSVILVALSIFLSLSRGGILSLCVSLALLGFLLSRRIINRKGGLLLVSTVIIIFYAVGWFGWTPLFERFRSIRTPQGEVSELRLDIWKDSIGIVRDFPLTGTGAGSFIHAYPAYRTIPGRAIADHAHNDHIELLTNGGIIGAGLFVWFIAAVLVTAYQAFQKRRDPYSRHISAGLFAAIAAFFLHSATDFNFFIGANGLYLFLLLGLAVNAARLDLACEKQTPANANNPFPSKFIAWGSVGLLLLSLLFHAGQMLSSVLWAEATRISLAKASPEALSYVRNAVARASFLDPLEPSHRHLLGRTEARLSDRQAALMNYLGAVRLSPSNAGYLQALGSAIGEGGDMASAGDVFALSITRAPRNPDMIKQYGSFLLRAGKKEEALSHFRAALALEPEEVRKYTAFLLLEGLSDAEILKVIPETAGSYITFADYLDATGSPQQALSVYEEAAAMLRRSGNESAGIYWRLSQFAAVKSRTKEALGILQLAGERFPKDIGIRLTVADYYEKLGLRDEAAAEYRKVLSLDPENKRAIKQIQAITGQPLTGSSPSPQASP